MIMTMMVTGRYWAEKASLIDPMMSRIVQVPPMQPPGLSAASMSVKLVIVDGKETSLPTTRVTPF
eukprot:CAMPEP_0195027010 /NCGR_PEP_ID=MMETSP0326_2-20130528/51478_1 /TAXON_ID=2866 ORGANISM="Crypthecodinium cohnii, Strain Seligo" /NCGR_SAMPLE_ID=MMETSP0326_2 /ASSEMBLY_ACC=CAM_ASM_000348 /LENGTH=64 /DNA_ID=CAMNT_0040049083 /DNA_START=28 /DNA_END=219 /DNA_ORIENTATION=+